MSHESYLGLSASMEQTWLIEGYENGLDTVGSIRDGLDTVGSIRDGML